uniref:Knl1 C-terminal RWD domain-containing protein n=1 Tax=Pyxicephalus adspersus TaxID=30357 RepID=A0AAV2ZKN3_PYXAD|nr:TPA: hypothetical protein GDO54_005145 [Pyxicephalus adspersus]
MDMTTSNTVAIDGLLEEKPKKIDTSLFLESLKAHASDESSNFDLKFSTTTKKPQECQSSTTSSCQTKIKFGDFLDRLSNENTASLKLEGVDKENIFPFVSKENLFSTKTMLQFYDTQENTANITRVFRDQEDGLDLTKCHTTNITSFLPTINHQPTNLSSGIPSTSNYNAHDKPELSHLEEANVKPPKFVSTNQTVLCEDDMDMTFSHTTRIHGVLKENATPDKTKVFVASNEKTIIFTDENEMELTKNDSVFINSILKRGRQSIQRNSNAFSVDQTIVHPEEDMEMTRSHTVAINGSAVCEIFKKQVIGDTIQSSKRQQSFGLSLPLQDIKQNKSVLKNTDVVLTPFSEKTVLFGCEQDDMEITKSHTIAIDSNAPGVKSNSCIPNTIPNDKRSHFIGLRLSSGFNKTVFFSDDSEGMDLTQNNTVRIDQTKRLQQNMKITGAEHDGSQIGSALAATDKTVVFTCEQQDMDITKSYTVAIDGDAWSKGLMLDPCINRNKELDYVSTKKSNVGLGSKIDSKNVAMQSFVDRNVGFPGASSKSVPCRKSVGQVYGTIQDNTIVFPSDQDEMELTKSHTIAIDNKMLSALDSTHKLNSILKDKKTKGNLRLSTMHNKTVFFSTDTDDMELTQSHTTCFDQNNLACAKQKHMSNDVDQTRHVLDDMEITMVGSPGRQRSPAKNVSDNKTVVFTCDQQDMDITRSHTVAIDRESLSRGYQSDICLGNNKRDEFVSAMSRCLTDKNVVPGSMEDCGNVIKMDTLMPLSKPEFRLSDRSMNITNMSCQKSTDQVQSMLSSNPVFVPYQDNKRLLQSGESTNKAITHTPYPDKTVVFDDDMEYTKSHTAIIDGINTNELSRRSVFSKTVAFSADDMDMTKSNTVFIDNIVTDKRAKDDQQHKLKNTLIKFSGPCDQIIEDSKLTMVYNKPLLPEKSKVNEAAMPESLEDKMLKSLDQEDMDLTRANTIAIENKVFSQVEKLQATNLNKTENGFPCNLAASYKNVVDPKAQHCPSPADSNEADMDITKSNTVFNHIPTSRMPLSMTQSKDVPSSQSCQKSTDQLQSMLSSNPVFLPYQEDKRVLQSGESTINKAFTHAPYPDKTVVFEDDMEYTKSHTAIIDGINRNPLSRRSVFSKTVAFSADDMDMTKSNTVFIDNVVIDERAKDDQQQKYKNTIIKFFEPCDQIMGNPKMTTVYNKPLLSDKSKVDEKVATMPEWLKDKTLHSLDQEDIDLTRANTTAIKNKVFSQVGKLQATNESKTENGFAASYKNVVDPKAQHCASPVDANEVDMDIIKSNAVFVNQIPTSRMLPSMTESVDVPSSQKLTGKTDPVVGPTVLKNIGGELTNHEQEQINENFSLVPEASQNRTLRLPCHKDTYTVTTENTSSNIHPYSSRLMLGNKDKANETVYQCHTTAIESKPIETTFSEYPVWSDCSVHKPAPLFSKDMSMNAEAGMLKSGKECNPFLGNKVTYKKPSDECVLPCEQEITEITKAHTAIGEVNTVEENGYANSIASNFAKNENKQPEKFLEVSNMLSGTSQKCENILKESMFTKEKKESKHNELSISLPSKTVLVSEDLGEMELAQMDTGTVHSLSEIGKKISSAGIEKTCLFLETEIDFTKSNIVSIDQEFKEAELGTFKNKIKGPSSLVPLVSSYHEGIDSDHKDTNTDADMALDKKYIMPHCEELLDHKVLSDSTQTIPLGAQTVCDQKPTTALSTISDLGVPSELSDSCTSQEQKTVAEYTCTQQSEACVTQKIPRANVDNQVTKKHRLSKRVSFCFPEKDIQETVAEPNTEKSLQNKQKLPFVPNIQSDISCLLESNQHLNNSIAGKNMLSSDKHVNEEIANNAQDDEYTIEGSQKEKNRRRSIANIHLKIRSLTEQSKKRPSNHTAPVSCPTELSILPQTPDPASGNFISEQTLFNKQEKDTQANEDEPKERDSGTTKDTCLQTRLSVNVLHPKLPSKRPSSTSISKPPNQTSRTSLSLLKAFTDGDPGHCIDEEILPTCLDDHDGNSLFQYEVPEGAWEELFEEEVLHKNQNDCPLSKETLNSYKRARDTEDETKLHREKRARRNDDIHNTQISVNECSRSEYSSHHTSKTMEQTYCSSSSQDSRGEGMSVDLSSQQYSRMDSQLPLDIGCGQSLWQKFRDGTITVKEFFMLLQIRIIIQKPRYSELPFNRGNYETPSFEDLMQDQFIYQPQLQVYEEEYHALCQTTEELKLYTDVQEKPLAEVSSLLWEAIRMCSEDEVMCFGMTLKHLKSVYSKKSKVLAHEAKVSIYSKLLHNAEVQVVEVQRRINETDKLLEEIDDCIYNLEIETNKLEMESKDNLANIPGGKEIHCELERLSNEEQIGIRERSNLEERKEKVLTQLGCLQDEARSLDKRLQDPCFAEWDMVKWTDTEAMFVFLYDSLELTVMFGEEIDGVKFNNQLCRTISRVILTPYLNKEAAPPSSLLVHRLILQFIKIKGCLHETYKMQKDLPELLFDVSLVVSRCKLLGEEVEYLMKWGAKYNIMKTEVENNEVKLLFSSSAASAKFELCVQISEMYPTAPLSFTMLNRIGNIEYSKVAAVISSVPVGPWLLKRAVKNIHEHLLV